MGSHKRLNPWLGLESYREGEVLYGRDNDIRDLTQCVLNDTDTLLYGKSGIGKSSILNAGIIPAARRHGYLPVLIRLSHKEHHSYLEQIKESIALAMIPILADESGNQIQLSNEELKKRESELASRIKEIIECRDKDKESFYEYFHRHTFHAADGERLKLLLIFDQFEEIFTLQTDEFKKKRFFVELADFLNDIMPSELQCEGITQLDSQEEAKIVEEGNLDDLFNDIDLGVRNDFPKYITDNEIHLVFTIREDFLSEFEYYSASIPSLKQNRYGLRPINDEQAAQIILRPMPGLISEPVAKLIIEKVTGRTDFKLDGIPEIEVDSAVLSLYLNRLYDAKTEEVITSELVEQKGGEIIADFYNDAISDISDSTIEYLEDMLLNGQGRRDNITIFDAINDGGATEKELDVLCNKKKILRQFNYAGDLRIEYVHDILCPVVKAHKDERLLLKQQEENRLKQEKEKKELLEKQKEELTRIERENEKQRKKIRNRFGIVLAILTFIALSMASWYMLNKMEFKVSYASFTTKDGWPVGIGKELSDNDKKQMPVYYQLVRYGYRSKNTRVNVLNSHKNLSHNLFNASPLVGLYETESSDEKAKEFAVLQRQTAYWLYTPDNDGNILRKTAYNINDKELYAVMYFRSSVPSIEGNSSESHNKQLWANYVDKDGKSMRVRNNGADRVRILVNDSTGYYIGHTFYSETGTPQSNYNGVYGYRYQLDADGKIIKRIPVDEFGDLLNEEATVYESFDEYGRWTKTRDGKAVYSAKLVVYSMSNRTDSLKFNQLGELLYHSETKTNGEARVFHYDKGEMIKTFHYRKSDSFLRLVYSKQVLPKEKNNVRETLVFWADSTIHYRIKREEISSKRMTITYYGGVSADSINLPLVVSTPQGKYHKLVSDTVFDNSLVKVTTDYYDEHGNLSPYCKYNHSVAYYNNNNEMIKHIVYKDGCRVFAYLNEYEDGQIISQSVMGVDDSTAIRYAGWDQYHLCYYKMKIVYNFSNTLVAIKGINEFGEESLITTPDHENYIISILPSAEMSTTIDDADVYGLQVYKIQTPAINRNRKVEYIHILNKEGTWYKAGIRDGDLLISELNPIKIARPNRIKKTYDLLSISVREGPNGAEHYPVFFTENEMARYNNTIKQIKK